MTDYDDAPDFRQPMDDEARAQAELYSGGLVTKLCQVMQSVRYIQKKGVNTFHRYNYATEADISDAIRNELASRNVMLFSSVAERHEREIKTRKGHTETVTTVRMVFRFVDGDTGESQSFWMDGSGQDPGDKGIFKAITGAVKYALMKTFLIPTGDDPEADKRTDESHDEPSEADIAEAKRQACEAAAREHADSVATIRDGIDTEELGLAAEAWFELPKEAKVALWLAPSKGGVFTTKQRAVMQSKEFKDAYYGPNGEDAA